MKNFRKIAQENFIKVLSISFLIFLSYYLFQPKSFESTVSLYPSYQNDTSLGSNLMDIASEFGIGKKINSSNAVIYTPDIIKSFSLKRAILLNNYKSLDNKSLIDYYIDNEFNFLKQDFDYERKIQAYSKTLENNIFISIGRVSGLITLKTYFHSPELSSEVCNFIQIYLKDFINQSTIETSQARIVYFEERLSEISNELNLSEEILENFLIDNKDIKSPLLQTQYLRYMRDVELNNQTYIFLKQQIESEKVQLKKDELNFVISDKYTDLEEKKSSLLLILFVYLFFIMLIYLWAFKSRYFFSFTSNHVAN